MLNKNYGLNTVEVEIQIYSIKQDFCSFNFREMIIIIKILVYVPNGDYCKYNNSLCWTIMLNTLVV